MSVKIVNVKISMPSSGGGGNEIVPPIIPPEPPEIKAQFSFLTQFSMGNFNNPQGG